MSKIGYLYLILETKKAADLKEGETRIHLNLLTFSQLEWLYSTLLRRLHTQK